MKTNGDHSLDQRMRVLDQQLTRVVSRMPTVDLSDVAAIRRLNTSTRMPLPRAAADVVVAERTVPGPDRAPDVRVRVYRHRNLARPAAGVLHSHPGLFFGTLEMDHARCMQWAAALECTVISVDYRLAPEHCFPAGLEDCFAVLRWMAAGGDDLAIDRQRIGVAGCSTGGTLAAALALMARDRGGPPIAFQMLLYPALDDRLATPSMKEFAAAGPMEAGKVGSAYAWRYYLGGHDGDVSPYAAPARCRDLSGLPPAYVATAESDCVRDEGIDYARRLMLAKVPTELHHFPGTFHAFDLVVRTAAISQRAIEEQIAVLARALCPRAGSRRTSSY